MQKHKKCIIMPSKNIFSYELRKEQSKMVIESEIEQKAAELEVTVDYYMEEFM
jgi:hypothetical protein